MQPIDPYFTGWKHKSKVKPSVVVAAKIKRSWPAGSQFKAQVKLEMRGGERPDWWHFLDVPADRVEEELGLWRAKNPGYEFRVESAIGTGK